MIRLHCSIAALSVCALLGACTTTADLNPQYAVAGLSQPTISGHATIVMADEARTTEFNGGPNSFSGGGTRLHVPLGTITEAVGARIGAAYFTDGANIGQDGQGEYIIKIGRPEFHYKFDQLSNIFLAVSPKVTVSVPIAVFGPDGSAVVPEKIYLRSNFNPTGSYAVNFHPMDDVDEALNLALADIFREALDRIPAQRSALATAAGE